ncbi:MAG: hypothetical protein P8X61_00340 [Limibacillus sp.]|jgi:hypothetical protein
MQNRNHDGSIDMNAFAAILSLAPKRADEKQQAFTALGRLDAEWVEGARNASLADNWDPWGAEESIQTMRKLDS